MIVVSGLLYVDATFCVQFLICCIFYRALHVYVMKLTKPNILLQIFSGFLPTYHTFSYYLKKHCGYEYSLLQFHRRS